MVLFLVGIILGVLTIAGVVSIFIYLAKHQKHLDKLPWIIYLLASILLVMALASIALVIIGGVIMK